MNRRTVARIDRSPLNPHRVFCALVLAIAGCSSEPPYQGKTAAELEAMLRDADPIVQTQGAYGLSRLGAQAKSAVPALIDALKSKDVRVRTNAALALGEIGPEAKAAVTALQEAINDPEWTFRRQAALALGRIGPDAKPATPALQKLQADDPDELVRKAAAEALQKIGG